MHLYKVFESKKVMPLTIVRIPMAMKAVHGEFDCAAKKPAKAPNTYLLYHHRIPYWNSCCFLGNWSIIYRTTFK